MDHNWTENVNNIKAKIRNVVEGPLPSGSQVLSPESKCNKPNQSHVRPSKGHKQNVEGQGSIKQQAQQRAHYIHMSMAMRPWLGFKYSFISCPVLRPIAG